MKLFIDLAITILMLSVLYSCNADVFVDDFRTVDSAVSLDGSGDSAIIKFASPNWDYLELYIYDNILMDAFKVYDENNNLVTENQNPYLKGLGKIVCDENRINFMIERSNPKELKITVKKNVRPTHLYLILLASNEYERQEIHVDISPSHRHVIDRSAYSLDSHSPIRKTEKKKSLVLHNEWGIDYSFPLNPLEHANDEVTFKNYNPQERETMNDNRQIEKQNADSL